MKTCTQNLLICLLILKLLLWKSLVIANWLQPTLSYRVEICRDRHDRRSCKICASSVNFPGNQRDVPPNLRRTTRSTHTKCDFAPKMLRFDTLTSILTKKLLN